MKRTKRTAPDELKCNKCESKRMKIKSYDSADKKNAKFKYVCEDCGKGRAERIVNYKELGGKK